MIRCSVPFGFNWLIYWLLAWCLTSLSKLFPSYEDFTTASEGSLFGSCSVRDCWDLFRVTPVYLTQSACTYWATIGIMSGCWIQVDVRQTVLDQRWANAVLSISIELVRILRGVGCNDANDGATLGQVHIYSYRFGFISCYCANIVPLLHKDVLFDNSKYAGMQL